MDNSLKINFLYTNSVYIFTIRCMTYSLNSNLKFKIYKYVMYLIMIIYILLVYIKFIFFNDGIMRPWLRGLLVCESLFKKFQSIKACPHHLLSGPITDLLFVKFKPKLNWTPGLKIVRTKFAACPARLCASVICKVWKTLNTCVPHMQLELVFYILMVLRDNLFEFNFIFVSYIQS